MISLPRVKNIAGRCPPGVSAGALAGPGGRRPIPGRDDHKTPPGPSSPIDPYHFNDAAHGTETAAAGVSSVNTADGGCIMSHVTASIGNLPYAVSISTGNHRLASDEPVVMGGGDHGPTPHDLLLSGLASCTLITLKMYAHHKHWPLLALDVEGAIIFADDRAAALRRDGACAPAGRRRRLHDSGFE